jgi:hypothetical protein
VIFHGSGRREPPALPVRAWVCGHGVRVARGAGFGVPGSRWPRRWWRRMTWPVLARCQGSWVRRHARPRPVLIRDRRQQASRSRASVGFAHCDRASWPRRVDSWPMRVCGDGISLAAFGDLVPRVFLEAETDRSGARSSAIHHAMDGRARDRCKATPPMARRADRTLRPSAQGLVQAGLQSARP